MQTMKLIQRNLKQRLNRGTKVVIGESYPDPTKRGKQMVLASKSTVVCKRGGRCAHDGCVGLAVFVTEPENLTNEEKTKKGKNIGWRANTIKICLTHLKTPEGDELVPDNDESGDIASTLTAPQVGNGHTNRVAPHFETEQRDPSSGTHQRPSLGDTSYDALSAAAARGDLNEVTRIARALKAQNEQLRERVVDLQDRLLNPR